MTTSAPDPTSEPLPDDSQDPALDIIEEQDHDFTLEDMNAVFRDMDTSGDDDLGANQDEGGVPEAGEDTPLEPAAEDIPASPAEPQVEEVVEAPDPASTPPATPPGPAVVEIAGQQFPADQVAALIDWANQLTPEQWQLLNQPPGPEPTPEPQFTPPPEDEIVDPALAKYVEERLSAQQAELEAVRAQVAAQQQVVASQYQSELEAALTTARQGISEKFGLSDAEADALLAAANSTPAANAVVQQYDLNADPVAAFTAALETAYWLTPEFRDRAIAEQVTTAVAEHTVSSALEEKKALNQGLVGSGAAAPRVSRPAPSTPDERHAAMVNRIAETLSQN